MVECYVRNLIVAVVQSFDVIEIRRIYINVILPNSFSENMFISSHPTTDKIKPCVIDCLYGKRKRQ